MPSQLGAGTSQGVRGDGLEPWVWGLGGLLHGGAMAGPPPCALISPPTEEVLPGRVGVAQAPGTVRRGLE